MSASPGQHGGTWANAELRRSFGIAGSRVVEEPAVTVSGAAARFAATPPELDADLMTDLRSVYWALLKRVEEARQDDVA